MALRLKTFTLSCKFCSGAALLSHSTHPVLAAFVLTSCGEERASLEEVKNLPCAHFLGLILFTEQTLVSMLSKHLFPCSIISAHGAAASLGSPAPHQSTDVKIQRRCVWRVINKDSPDGHMSGHSSPPAAPVLLQQHVKYRRG